MGPIAFLLLEAMTLVGPDRPPALLGDAPADAYSAWLAGAATEAEGLHNGVDRRACASAAARSLGWRLAADPYLAPVVARHATASIVEKVQVTGCGRDHVQTLVVYRAEGRDFRVVRLAQGQTLAPIRASWDATRAMAEQAWAHADRSACSTEDGFRTGDTRLAPSASAGEWSELWPVTVCGASQTFLVRFKLQASGQVDFQVERQP